MANGKETITQIELPPEIEEILEDLRVRIEKMGAVSSGGSALANETLSVIGEKARTLANIAIQQRIDTLPAVETMRRVLQEIISASTDDQDGVIQLTSEQAIVVGKYADSIGPEPSGSRIVNTTQKRQEIKLDLKERGIVTIIIHLSGPTVLAWKLNRQKTEEEKERHVAAWLDRIYEERSSANGTTLTQSESEDFLRTFDVEEPQIGKNREIASPRTFATIHLNDRRTVSMTLSGDRNRGEFIAEWKNPEQQPA